MQGKLKTNFTVNDLFLMLDDYDHSRIADDIYFTLDPDGEDYDFMGKDGNLSLEYIYSHIPTGVELEKKFSSLKKVVGALVIRNKINTIISDVDKDLDCDFYLDDIGIDIDNDSFHINISQIIIESSQVTTQFLHNVS
jgi:hypothetical protein